MTMRCFLGNAVRCAISAAVNVGAMCAGAAVGAGCEMGAAVCVVKSFITMSAAGAAVGAVCAMRAAVCAMCAAVCAMGAAVCAMGARQSPTSAVVDHESSSRVPATPCDEGVAGAVEGAGAGDVGAAMGASAVEGAGDAGAAMGASAVEGAGDAGAAMGASAVEGAGDAGAAMDASAVEGAGDAGATIVKKMGGCATVEALAPLAAFHP